jgi:hypothetical protein
MMSFTSPEEIFQVQMYVDGGALWITKKMNLFDGAGNILTTTTTDVTGIPNYAQDYSWTTDAASANPYN